MVNKNYPIWLNFIRTEGIDFLMETIVSNGIKTAYVFGYDNKLFTKIMFKGKLMGNQE